MPISVTCPCGRAYRVGDEHAGKNIRCRQCSNVLPVPLPEAQEVPEEMEPTSQRMGITTEKPKFRLGPPPDEAPPAPPKVKRRRRRRRRDDGGSFLPISISPGIILGLVMILGGITWLVLGLMVGVLFYWGPPVLVVGGAIRFFRSLTGGDDD